MPSLAAEGLSGVVAQEGAFDEGGEVFLLVGGELVDGFELEPQRLALGSSFVFVEEERVSADVERDRQCTEDVEGGLAAAGFVTMDLGDMGTGAVGELLLAAAARCRSRSVEEGRSSSSVLRARFPAGVPMQGAGGVLHRTSSVHVALTAQELSDAVVRIRLRAPDPVRAYPGAGHEACGQQVFKPRVGLSLRRTLDLTGRDRAVLDDDLEGPHSLWSS
nr:hypothetical protein [Yimella sp. cx-51]